MGLAPATWLQRTCDSTLDLFFPPICVSCQADMDDIEQGIGLCGACRQQLQLVAWPTCRRCGSRVPEIPGATEDCGDCRGEKLWFDRALALGSYEGLLGELVVRMKTDRSERLARTFGSLLLAEMGQRIRELNPEAIVPVPMHRWRRLARGTNSPAAVAARLSQGLGVPVLTKALRRRNSSPQKGLSRSGRFRNMRGQIVAKAGYPLVASHVLLIDDILTTGATCSEASRALKQGGVAEVSVLVLGRTSSS